MKQIQKLVLVLALAASTNAYSQLYVGFGTGYGLGLATVNFSDDYVGTSNSSTYTSNKSSFGMGVPLTLSLGYKTNENMAFELGLSYLMGTTETFSYASSGAFGSNNSTIDLKARMLRIVPAIRLNVGTGKLQPYMRFGLSLGVMTKLTETDHSTNIFGGNTSISHETLEFTGGLSFGINSALGFNYSLSEKLKFFAELNVYGQSWSPKRAILTESDVNGIDQLPFMTTSQKETEFVDEYTDTGTSNPGSPDKSTQVHFPFSSIGLQVGISFHL